jgi:hypothetical protein
MDFYDDDMLDRALRALPLEEPPADLRASILASTVYRPGPLLATWETVLLGAGFAVIAWLVVMMILGGGTLFFDTLKTIGMVLERALSSGVTLAWIAAGISTAIWLTLFTGFQPLAKGVKARDN